MPVLAAPRNPPANTTAGTAYNQEYSGGSVGPRNTGIDQAPRVITMSSGLTLKHV
jgi:hypothetical protein